MSEARETSILPVRTEQDDVAAARNETCQYTHTSTQAILDSLVDHDVVRLDVSMCDIVFVQAISHNADELIEHKPSDCSRDWRADLGERSSPSFIIF